MQNEPKEHDATDRRSLLRAGAAVVAGAVGIAAVEAVGAPGADAAAGGNLVLGQFNDAGTARTSLTSSSPEGTLEVLNTNSGLAAQLTLPEQSIPDNADFSNFAPGDVANLNGDLCFVYDVGGGAPYIGTVYTDWWASQLIPITPTRILDTRTTTGRESIVSTSGRLDSSHRLKAGKSIEIDLSGIVIASIAAYANLTAVTPTAGGYLTIWPGGSRPNTSSLNFRKDVTLANAAITGTSLDDTVTIYASSTTHVLLDIVGFGVGGPWQVNPAVLGAAATHATPAARIAARRAAGKAVPRWYRDTATGIGQ